MRKHKTKRHKSALKLQRRETKHTHTQTLTKSDDSTNEMIGNRVFFRWIQICFNQTHKVSGDERKSNEFNWRDDEKLLWQKVYVFGIRSMCAVCMCVSLWFAWLKERNKNRSIDDGGRLAGANAEMKSNTKWHKMNVYCAEIHENQ